MKAHDSNVLMTAYKTRKSLLLRLKDQSDQESWRDFYNIYGRMIFGYALRYGLSHSEAEDVVQEVCIKLFRQILSFDYSLDQGHFRGWLKTVTKHAVIDFIRRKQRRLEKLHAYRQHNDAINEEDNAKDVALWEEEWEKAVFDTALLRVYERISEPCRHAFHLFAIENLPADKVSELVGIKANAIYACKHRIIRMIREEVEVLKNEI